MSATVDANTIVITAKYEAGHHLESGWQLKKALTDLYVDTVAMANGPERPSSCLLELDASIADSHLVRAIFELYRLVVRADGKLACVGYPNEFIESLTSLQMMELPNFDVFDESQEARTWLAS